MSRGEKWFTEEEKDRLREQLCDECEKHWRAVGYRKTSISALTKKVGISTGAFYTLYPSKEDLFLLAFQKLREQQMKTINNIITENPTLEGGIEAIKYSYRLYDENPFLYDFSSPDLWALIKKLPLGKWEEITKENADFLSVLAEKINLTPKVSPQKIHAVLATLMYTITFKGKISYDNYDVFDFLVDCSMKELFE